MIRCITQKLRRFRAHDDGNASVEFAIVIPAFLLALMSTVELGLINLRHSQLERALDLTVRDIRLNTGANKDHAQIRDEICELSGFIDDCASSLKLEMVRADPFNWTGIDPDPDCINRIEEVNPDVTFEHGQSNELMLIRACMKFKPILPTWGLGQSLSKDDDGRISLTAASAFVQEPR
ncbi:pilus assembly protein [Leisingera sp. M527]|uniref:TadE/TadG family type IV pilus assembly protein n=1 Tax=unclassified Leisingera TaxID=2614906 RepID=UPI00101032C6|nr:MULTISPECIES: TadE/TadG family type IV pilus assembly protein [unclassified Leisingera]MCF6431824.1 pilus assembly protein [Leisingera sp. MMG026]QAX30357.1 pilus assembly protein [Leisingera sp. NJS204]UWQ31708.1 pilus assembly protein [Leisingera sp. M527]UWQ73694.1 pilus assembly protein [Leisingera sp. M658]